MVKRKTLNKKKRTSWYKDGRTDLWWKYFVSGVTPKEFWKKNFRLEEASFFDLASHLRPYISPNPNLPNRRALCANKKVAITLYFLKDYGTVSITANSFGIATNTASAVINKVCNAIVFYVGPKYLHLPKTNQEMKEKIAESETKFGMTLAFGCIDGTQSLLYAPLNTLTIISVTDNSIHLVHKLHAIIKVLLWMLNVSGLVVFTMQKYLQTLLFANIYVALTYLQYFKL